MNEFKCDIIFKNFEGNIISKKNCDTIIIESKYGEGKNSIYKKLISQMNHNIKIIKELQIKKIAYISVMRHNNLYCNGIRNNDIFQNLKKEFEQYFVNEKECQIIIINLYKNKFLKDIDVTIKLNEKKQIIKEIKDYIDTKIEEKFQIFETKIEEKFDTKIEKMEKKFDKKFNEIIDLIKSLKESK